MGRYRYHDSRKEPLEIPVNTQLNPDYVNASHYYEKGRMITIRVDPKHKFILYRYAKFCRRNASEVIRAFIESLEPFLLDSDKEQLAELEYKQQKLRERR